MRTPGTAGTGALGVLTHDRRCGARPGVCSFPSACIPQRVSRHGARQAAPTSNLWVWPAARQRAYRCFIWPQGHQANRFVTVRNASPTASHWAGGLPAGLLSALLALCTVACLVHGGSGSSKSDPRVLPAAPSAPSAAELGAVADVQIGDRPGNPAGEAGSGHSHEPGQGGPGGCEVSSPPPGLVVHGVDLDQHEGGEVGEGADGAGSGNRLLAARPPRGTGTWGADTRAGLCVWRI